ncbi:hypothetical protein B0J14DRAFT_573949 [Halenospora varia]|nr:hypothetical protein B0J14DRAFT_573949 [Halenospora varia]
MPQGEFLRQVTVMPGAPSQAEIDEKPWKYLGYNAFSSYLVSDPDNLVVRRFSKLFSRGLLYIQDHLSELEAKLDALDKKYTDIVPEEDEVNNGTARDDMMDRKALVYEISKVQLKYYKMILMYSELGSWKCPKKRSIQNVHTWLFTNFPGVIMDDEADFIRHEDDLVSIIRAEKSPTRTLFEDWVLFRVKAIRRFFEKTENDSICEADKQTRKSVSEERLDVFSSLSILTVGLALFIAPLWILQTLNVFRWKLLVITIFVILFMTILTFSTIGRPFEVLATTAGYSAVMVVFLQFGTAQVGQ